jgi:hypothetical protein
MSLLFNASRGIFVVIIAQVSGILAISAIRYYDEATTNVSGGIAMDVIGWGSPVGLTIFMVGLAAAIFLLCLAARMVGGVFK